MPAASIPAPHYRQSDPGKCLPACARMVLAAFGDEHFQVQKLIQNKRTLTRVERLKDEPRLLELAQMLGEVGEGTLRSAHEILQTAQEITKTN